MDRQRHPHVIRTWRVERLRNTGPAPFSKRTDRISANPPKPNAPRRDPGTRPK